MEAEKDGTGMTLCDLANDMTTGKKLYTQLRFFTRAWLGLLGFRFY